MAAIEAPRVARVGRRRGSAYEFFILVLTLLALAIMVLLLLPLSEPVRVALTFYDSVICVVFVADFGYNLLRPGGGRAYLIGRRGWLDLIGAIPIVGSVPATALLRLARLNRVAGIVRSYRGTHQEDLLRDVIRNRGQYALFFTTIVVMLVITAASVLVLTFEADDPHATIRTGGDALWWTFVTLTTVGYGDLVPVTNGGRVIAVMVMFVGVGVIGALASILASILVPAPDPELESRLTGDAPHGALDATAARSPSEANLADEMTAVRRELAAAREELAAIRQALVHLPGSRESGSSPG